MTRHVIVKDGLIQNAIEVKPDNIATLFVRNDKGTRFAAVMLDGEKVISTTKYLPDEGVELIETDLGNPGDEWPLKEAE